MSDPLTRAERAYVEHWSRRRGHRLRLWTVLGAAGFGSVMAALAYRTDKLSVAMATLFIVLWLIGGALLGLGSWLLREFRYRKLRARSTGH